jgi:acyl-CoA thioester hydrolase
MPIPKIEIPTTLPLYTCTLPVRITDINYGNHLGNNALVGLLHEARVAFLHQHNLSELQVGNNTGLIMGSLAVHFKAEAFYGNALQISIYSSAISNVKFDLLYHLTYNNTIIAQAQTTMVCFSYALKKVQPIPPQLLAIL